VGLPEITEFLRRHRGGRSDEALRQDLLSQGHSAADVDAAFALDEAKEQHLQTQVLRSSAAELSIPWGKLLAVIAVVGLAAALGGLWRYGRGRRLGLERAAARQLAEYKPPPLAKPAHLELALPAGLVDADAAPDYARLFSPAAEDAEGGARAALDAALAKRRCTAALNWYPGTKPELLRKTALLSRGIAAAEAALEARLRAAPREQAAELARRRLLFGWHMMQDFSLVAQERGLAAAQAGLRDYGRLAGLAPEALLGLGQLAAELDAYAPDPRRLRETLALGARREDFATLTPLVSRSELRRPYLEAALLAAATNWSEEEALAASLWPERLELLRLAREAIDPRAARIGQAYGALLESLRRAVEEQPQERRLEALREARAGLEAVVGAGR
jgi:hypothetical protein